MSITLEEMPARFQAYKRRWSDRNERMDDIIDAVKGNYDVDDPHDDAIANRSPNFIQVALEDTAEAASLVPTVRVDPSGPTDEAREAADYMERAATATFDVSQIELLSIQQLMVLAAYGLASAIVLHDDESGGPVISFRDPRFCYPEPGWRTMDSVRSCFFARELYVSQLPEDWQEMCRQKWPNDPYLTGHRIHYAHDKKIILVEYFDEDEMVIAGLYQSGVQNADATVTHTPIEFHREDNPTGVCPVVVGQRLSLENEPRGQFDQLIGMMRAHIRLMGLILDYADQAVYSDIWVKDLIGPLNFGGGSYIQLGPNGGIGRIPPAQTDITVFRELDSLIENMHLAGRYPKSRPGEIDQAIASAKFLEASAGVMNTVIRTYHLIMKRFWEQALRVAFITDKKLGRSRMLSGVLRNQQFTIERDSSKIDLKAKIRVDYGLALGHDPAQAAVLGIQMHQSGFISREFVQENFEGITDVSKENARIDVERFRDMAFARLLQGLEQGSIPDKALIEIARARARGDDVFEIFEEFVIAPQEEAMANQLQTGLGGPVQPGPQSPLGAQAPPAPSPEALLGALAGGGGAPPEEGPNPASRLNVPLGDGSFASTNVQ